MKILILNPPGSDKHYINRDQMGGMGQKISFGKDFKSKLLSALKSEFIHLPVMQLVYTATILNQYYQVKVIDALNEDKNINIVINEIKNFQPDYVFMAVSSSEILYERDVVAKNIKQVIPNCKIITIGDMITEVPDLIKQPFDIGITGEVEKVIIDIVKNKELSSIHGIIYRKNGKLIINKRLPFLTNKEMEDIPFPKWELFNYKKFTYYPLIFKKPVATMLTSRGCPFGCYYCSYSKNMGTMWRARSTKNVFDEMNYDYSEYGFKGISIRDPVFSLDKSRTEEIADIIIKNKLNILWTFETRPELLTKDLLNKLHRAGCSGINMGIESITPNVLKSIGRNSIPLEKIKEIISHAEKIGIRTTCFFMFGLPMSTRKSIEDNIKFSLDLNPSHAEYKIATPFPGTKMHEMAKKNKWIISEDYSNLGGYSSTMKISEEMNPEYLEKISSEAFKKFYLRKSYIVRELRRGNILTKNNILTKSMLSAMNKVLSK